VESALEQLATEAAARGDHASSVQRWQRLATMEPRKTRVVLSLMSELAASGDRAGALRHAEIYDTLVRDDLDAKPNPAVAALAERLRREPAAVRATPVARGNAATDGAVSEAESMTPPSKQGEPVPDASPPRRRLTTEWLRRRTTRAYRVATLATLLAATFALSLLWAVTSQRRSNPDRAWVVPADVDNRTQDTVFDGGLDAALAAGLQQSPYVSVFPRARVQQTLLMMQRAPAAGVMRLDESLAREVGQREGIHTVVAASIARIDSSYVLTARLVDATSGATIAAESRKANRRADVIDALDALVRSLRRDIGESPETIAKHDLPLPEATTRSLDALRAYARGNAAWVGGQRAQARELY
jgi:TolB-like protein